jgi:hypothetical protein
VIDQYPDDGYGQHRTEHDIDRFKCVAVPHHNRANVTTILFKSDPHGLQIFNAASRHSLVAHQGQRGLRSFGVISIASVTAAEQELSMGINGG